MSKQVDEQPIMFAAWQGWQNECYPDDGTWCWVSDGKRVWLAKQDVSAANTWTNEDTWEDFGNEVAFWMPIEKPDPPAPPSAPPRNVTR